MEPQADRHPFQLRDNSFAAYALAFAISAVAILARFAFAPALQSVQFITFFPAVLIAAYSGGARAGVLSAVLCGLAGWYFFLPPQFSFAVKDANTAATLLFYFSIAVILAMVIGAMRSAIRRERQAIGAVRESEERLRTVMEQMPVGVIIASIPSGEVLVANRKSEELLGHPAAARSTAEYGTFGGIHEDGSAYAPEEYPTARALTGARVDEHELRYRRPDGTTSHLSVSAVPVRREAGDPEFVVCTFVSIDERKRFEAHQGLLINELNHRVKNTLAIVQSIAQQTFKGADVPVTARQGFEGRLAALSAAHNVLNEQLWEAAPIREIVERSISAHRGSNGAVTAEGPDLLLPPKAAVSIAIGLHELATNASKYGALSTPDGNVRLRWAQADGRLRLEWEERNGPTVTPPSKRGFGTRMIEQALASELEGDVRLEFRVDGVVCTIDAPLAPAEKS